MSETRSSSRSWSRTAFVLKVRGGAARKVSIANGGSAEWSLISHLALAHKTGRRGGADVVLLQRLDEAVAEGNRLASEFRVIAKYGCLIHPLDFRAGAPRA